MKYLLAPIFIPMLICYIVFVIPIVLATSALRSLLGLIPYWLMVLVFITLYPIQLLFPGDIQDAVNKFMARILGYSGEHQLSYETGELLTPEFKQQHPIRAFFMCCGCRLVATYDANGWHCNPTCKSLV